MNSEFEDALSKKLALPRHILSGYYLISLTIWILFLLLVILWFGLSGDLGNKDYMKMILPLVYLSLSIVFNYWKPTKLKYIIFALLFSPMVWWISEDLSAGSEEVLPLMSIWMCSFPILQITLTTYELVLQRKHFNLIDGA